MAAAMALGAQGVWCGSVWLTTNEAETHPVVKQKFLAATSSDTVRSRSLTGKPARQLRTAWTDEWDNPDNPKPLGMPMQPILVAEAQARISRAAYKPGSGAEQLSNYFDERQQACRPGGVRHGRRVHRGRAVTGPPAGDLSSDGSVLGGRVARPIDG